MIQSPEKSRTSLATFRHVYRDDGAQLVIVPGYNDGKFGYIVCYEKHTAVGNPHDDWYEYSNPLLFAEKLDEDVYPSVVKVVESFGK